MTNEKIPIYVSFAIVDDYTGHNVMRSVSYQFSDDREIVGPVIGYINGVKDTYENEYTEGNPFSKSKIISVYLPFGFDNHGYYNLKREIEDNKITYKNKFTCEFSSDSPYYKRVNSKNIYVIHKDLSDNAKNLSSSRKYYIQKADSFSPKSFEFDKSMLHSDKLKESKCVGIIDDQTKERYIRYIPKDYKYYDHIFDNYRYILRLENGKYYLTEDVYYGK